MISRRKQISRTFSDDEEDDGMMSMREDGVDTDEYSTFIQVLKDAGYRLQLKSSTPGYHLINCDRDQFIKKAIKDLETSEDLVEPFIEQGLKYLEVDDHLDRCLQPSKTASSCTDARGAYQDTLLVLLLSLPQVQSKLAKWLLEKCAELALDEDSADRNDNKIKLILSQLKFLEEIQDGQALAEKLLEILEVTPYKVQLEIITSLPEIIDYSNHDRVANALSELFHRSEELSTVILDTLTNLNLKPETMINIRETVVKTMASSPAENLPVIVKFVMESAGADVLDTITTLRQELDLSPPPAMPSSSQNKMSFQDTQVLTLETIRISIFTNKNVAGAWIRTIDAIRNFKDQRPIDFIILLFLMDLPDRRKSAVSLFKNKLRSGVFTGESIGQVIEQFALTVKKKFENLMDLIEPLLTSSEPVLNDSASQIYVNIFLKLDKYCKQEVIGDLITRVSAATPFRDLALNILCTLASTNTALLLDYAVFATSILDEIDTMNFSQARRVYDVLSLLAYFNPHTASIIRDDLHIVLTKQLGSSKPRLKRMGVIGTVATIKNMSRSRDDVESMHEENGSERTEQSTSDESSFPLPTTILNQARDLLITVQSSTSKIGEIAGLFLDELANVVKTDNVDKLLVKWISKTMTRDFLADYVVDVKPNSTADDDYLKYALRWDLEDEPSEEEDSSIAVNIGPTVTRSFNVRGKDTKNEVSKAAKFISNFRLLKMCVSVLNDGDLSSIDALLGCPIWLVDPDVVKKFDSLSVMERTVICSSYFYALNWYRELLNAFAPAEDSDYRRKVVKRLKCIVLLQRQLRFCLRYHLDFVPPQVLHSVDVSNWSPPFQQQQQLEKGIGGKSNKKRGKKRKIEEDVSGISQVIHSQATSQITTAATQSTFEESAVNLDRHYAPFFRELDLDAFHILSYDTVSLVPQPDIEDEGLLEEEPKLRPLELLFLLNDLYAKFDHALVSKTGPKKAFPGKGGGNNDELKNAGFSNFGSRSAAEVATFGVKIIDYLLANLEIISDYLHRLLRVSNDDDVCEDLSLYNDQTPSLIGCYEKTISILGKILGWNGFTSKTSKQLLKEALSKMASRVYVQMTIRNPLRELVEASVVYFSKFSSTIFCSIGLATGLLRLLEIIKSIDVNSDNTDESISAKMVELAEIFLNKTWKTAEGKVDKGSFYNKQLEYLLKTYLANHDDGLSALENYVDTIAEVLEHGKCNKFATFTKATLLLHYRGLLSALISSSGNLTYGAKTDHEEQLELWDTSILILYKLVMVIKVQSTRYMLSTVAKQSRLFLDHFIKHGMPVVDKLFRKKRDDVITMLKNLQKVTRFLQHVCSHSKLQKDVTLSSHVPLLKKTLETFVFRVKRSLAYNDCLEAFIMGNLKNRDLQGVEICEEEEEEEEEEEAAAGAAGGEGERDDNDDDDGDDGTESDVEVEQNEDKPKARNRINHHEEDEEDSDNSNDDSVSIQV